MKYKLVPSLMIVIVLTVGGFAQTTTFTYQGSLKDGAAAANGTYDFQFALFDAVSGGNQIGSTLNRLSVAVANGIFSVSLDFSIIPYIGADRFLEIRVRLAGQPSLTTLTPRQSLTSAPFSIKTLFSENLIGTGRADFIQNGLTLQSANQNISGNAFFGGNVGIGTTTSPEKLTVFTPTTNYGLLHTDGTVSVGSFVGGSTGGGYFGTKSNHSFSLFANNGGPSLTIGTNGLVNFPILASAGGAALCRNGPAIAFCSSSLRYKTNIGPFDQGLSLLHKLHPITFDWKQDGMHDLGLGAEDVEKVEPLLVTYNDKGQVEGVKYDRIGIVLINAVKEQQEQIETLRTENVGQQKQNDELRKQVEALKTVVCSIKSDADICKGKEK